MNNSEDLIKKYKRLFKEALDELKTPERRYRQIPNILTSLRLLAPFFIIPAAIAGNVPLAIGFGTVFGLTDLADGYIARKWKLTTELGADLDAATDKIFTGTLLTAATINNPVLAINLTAEVIIALINAIGKKKGFNPSSEKIGKLKTWFLFSLAIAGVISSTISIETLVDILVITTATLQGFTIGTYLNKYKDAKEISKKEYFLQDCQTKEVNPEDDKIIGKNQEKIKDYLLSANQNRTTNNTNESQDERILEQLKEMSNFLHQEQANQKSTNMGISKGIAKKIKKKE